MTSSIPVEHAYIIIYCLSCSLVLIILLTPTIPIRACIYVLLNSLVHLVLFCFSLSYLKSCIVMFLIGVWTFDSEAIYNCILALCSIITTVSVKFLINMFWRNCLLFVFSSKCKKKGTSCWISRQPDLGFMKRLQQILGRKHQRNLHVSIFFLLNSSYEQVHSSNSVQLQTGDLCSPPNIGIENSCFGNADVCRWRGNS